MNKNLTFEDLNDALILIFWSGNGDIAFLPQKPSRCKKVFLLLYVRFLIKQRKNIELCGYETYKRVKTNNQEI